MTTRLISACRTAAALLIGLATMAQAQAKADSGKAEKGKYTSSKFWGSTTPLELTLVVNVRQLQGDKVDSAPWRAASVRYAKDSTPVTVKARIKTRGRSRLNICDRFPPTWVDFAKEDVKGTDFQHLNRFKLVSPCKVASEYERLVVQEYNVYRIHALFTPYSHRTRLLRLTVVDSASGKTAFTKYAFAVEDLDEVAERMEGKKAEVTGLMAADLDPRQLAVMGLLQYMVANTDFSFTAKHNLGFVATAAGAFYPINYDFDQAGLVNAPYATPSPSLGIRKVTDRLYRGLCVPTDTINTLLAEFKKRRPEIEALYKDDNGKLMGGSAVNTSIRFIDDFFSDIENPRVVQRDILARCAQGR